MPRREVADVLVIGSGAAGARVCVVGQVLSDNSDAHDMGKITFHDPVVTLAPRGFKRIVSSVNLPVTADIEGGYSDNLDELSRIIASVIDLGVVGINLEDSTPSDEIIDINVQAEKIRVVRGAASSSGADLFINARVDLYLLEVGGEQERLRNTISRGLAYKAAGADCIFIPGVVDKQVIEKLVKNIPAPINILGVSNTPPVGVLERLGVARVSVASGPARACATLARRIGLELVDRGTYSSFTQDAMSYKEINSLFQNTKDVVQ
jgi:2-methylisocitrate lyase-like PEP mutase family enzyme